MLRAYFALALAVSGIAWSAIFVRWAGVPGPVSAFYRVLTAGLVLFAWRALRGSTRQVSRRALWFAVAGGVFFALDLALWNTAVMRSQAAVAAILGNNTPIFVGILTWLVFRRRPGAAFWIGLALALGGCLLVLGASLNPGSARGSLSGNLLAIAASAFFAAYMVVTEHVRSSMDTLTFNAVTIAASVASLLAVCMAMGMPLSGFTPRTWTVLVALGLVSQLFAYFALVYALGHLPATITSVALLAQVPCTAALAWLLLDEPLTPAQITGGAVVLAGIYVVNRGDDRRSLSDGEHP
ncbi:MAG TPA: DMT family transporter [Vicinamibacterales bacterium]|nr:DMT family transporter [Vicinamibacterales bacterium]